MACRESGLHTEGMEKERTATASLDQFKIKTQLSESVTAMKNAIAKNAEDRRRSRSWGPLYTMVFWPLIDEFDLSSTDYNLADAIDKLSGNHSPIPGWCNASKAKLAALVRISEASLYRSLKALRQKGLIEEHPERKDLLRASRRWLQSVQLCERRLKH
jgi:hypothetical protein